MCIVCTEIDRDFPIAMFIKGADRHDRHLSMPILLHICGFEVCMSIILNNFCVATVLLQQERSNNNFIYVELNKLLSL